MKNIFALFLLAGLVSFTSCKNEGAAAQDETTESLATTETATDPAATIGLNNGQDASANQANQAEPVPTGPTTTISFDETTYDFGNVKEGEKVVHVYKFTNTGKEPLIISNAKGSCGCTVPQWPRDPIAPGKAGEIRVEFDSKGKGSEAGQAQSKRVTITANTDPVNTYLTIKGTVTKPAQ